jgi:tRNA A-37 threonylcarbamoyl transferase component Bud32
VPTLQEHVLDHPPAEVLDAFEKGDLSEEEAAEVEVHLQDCVACCDALAAIPADAFLSSLRQAHAGMSPAKRTALTPPPAVELGGLPTVAAAPGTPVLAGFEDLRELGRGGMGVVYSAVHRVMGRRVAVKLIHPEFAANPEAVERFRREARAVARLTHPNLVTAYDAGQDGERLFLVMECLDGESLADLVGRDGPLSIALACDCVRQAALGLQHAHDNGLVHRDVKPHNLMRTADGTVKVLDFGLAALADDRGRSGRTGPNAVMGTPGYMAPEQAEDARSADGRADVYSLGCTLFHLLTGKEPFPMDSTLLKLLAHRSQERPSARGTRPEVPAELDAVLNRAMARRPEERYPTPGALAEALAPFADPACLARLARSRRLRTLAALAGFLLLTAAVAAGVTRLPSGKDREIVIETTDAEVEVVVKGDRIVRIVDPKTGRSYRLDRTDLTISLVDDPDGLAVALDGKGPVVLKRQGKQIGVVRLETKAGPAQPRQPGQIFNGRDLTGWVVNGEPREAWRVEDGQIVGTGTSTGFRNSSWLLTEHSYEDFHLRFEFQLSKSADSGVALRAIPENMPGTRNCAVESAPLKRRANPGEEKHAPWISVQLNDDEKYRNPDGLLPPPTGSLFWAEGGSYLRPDRLAVLEPVGSWNEMTVESRGDSLRVCVNGREVLNAALDRLANQSDAKPGLKLSSGRIGFQQHIGEVRFRNIGIKEFPPLPPEKEVPPPPKATQKPDARFFNGKDLTGWVGLPGSWQVEDGAIVGACPDGRAAHTFLVSEKKYRDFDLKFQVRRLAGIGHSGVQFRSRLADPERYTVAGPKCWIDSTDSNTYAPGSLLIEPVGPHLEVGVPGADVAQRYNNNGFNDFHIRCVGKHVTIRVNGVTAVDGDYPELPDEGVIAWQLNGPRPPREVRFRNIEFTDLSEEFQPRFYPLIGPARLHQDASGAFLEMQAEYARALEKSKDFSKIQQEWLNRLTEFIKAHPGAKETPDALLAAGMMNELLDKENEARAWYRQLRERFPDTPQGRKATGALVRLESDGQRFKLAGPRMHEANQVFNIDSLQGKVVIVYWWATWHNQSKDDFARLKQVLDTHGKKGIELVCVNLDDRADDVREFVSRARFPGIHLHQAGGLESNLAASCGILMVPTVFVIDREGKMAIRKIQIHELSEELRRLLID